MRLGSDLVLQCDRRNIAACHTVSFGFHVPSIANLMTEMQRKWVAKECTKEVGLDNIYPLPEERPPGKHLNSIILSHSLTLLGIHLLAGSLTV